MLFIWLLVCLCNSVLTRVSIFDGLNLGSDNFPSNSSRTGKVAERKTFSDDDATMTSLLLDSIK